MYKRTCNNTNYNYFNTTLQHRCSFGADALWKLSFILLMVFTESFTLFHRSRVRNFLWFCYPFDHTRWKTSANCFVTYQKACSPLYFYNFFTDFLSNRYSCLCINCMCEFLYELDELLFLVFHSYSDVCISTPSLRLEVEGPGWPSQPFPDSPRRNSITSWSSSTIRNEHASPVTRMYILCKTQHDTWK